ncbi:FtsX-like permease family protein [Ilyomonas limi]|uniref:FtsX-like permease family protein n=1 Tax=Ilyomonas limi TaxID=2575867 RepID=A0A4V5UU36_9BACT|nr:ABC transporter permease [Ilyomonas limi]TKK67463.1 FtsX-like permease family protein [Ilyomonas limi]
MLKNYFKIAIAVLKRRKFFTFISLFGISFTLTILIVLTAFVDNIVSANYPEVNRDRSLYIISIQQKDTVHQGQMTGPASYYYLSHYVETLKTPAMVAISSMFAPTNAYVNNRKLVLNMKYTNDAFWKVLQFQFLEGKPYTQQQIENGEHIAVITEDTKQQYFGDVPSVVGKYIEADNVQYRVTGVVKSVPVIMPVTYADIFVPYTFSKADWRTKTYSGSYTAVLLANSPSDFKKIQAEYANVVAKIPPENKDFNVLVSSADTYLKSFLAISNKGNGVEILTTVILVFALFVMLLPTLNLININISRIMERSSEIGVRKAFGASSKTLVIQFIVENLILTIFGAVLGLLVSFIIIQMINNSNLIANIHLTINFTVLFYALLACLAFGLFSGVYPAWRMSKMHIATALKAQ